MTVLSSQFNLNDDSEYHTILPSADYCVLEHATVRPMLADDTPLSISGGVSHIELDLKFHQYRGAPIAENKTALDLATDIDTLPEGLKTGKKVQGAYIFGGPIFNNFGHFIAECIHRCWVYEFAQKELGLKIDAVIFTPQVRRRFSWFRTKTYKLPTVYVDILNYLGIPAEKITCAFTPKIFTKLIVAQQASYFRGQAEPQSAYLEYLERCFAKASVNTTAPSHKKLYVSRRDFSLRGAYAGEQYIQQFLETQGFEPYYPEQHSIISQLVTYKQAQEIIFAEGAALHILELVGKLNAKVSVLCRRSRSKSVFSPILGARIKMLCFMTNVVTLPSLFFDNNEQKKGANGSAISVLNTQTLVDFLHTSHNLNTDTFNQNNFNQAVKADVDNYLAHYSKNVDEKQPHKIEAIEKFNQACLKHFNS